MKENEARELLREHYKTLSLNGSFEETKEINGAISMAIQALEEIPRYRDLGTIDELAEMQVQYNYLSAKIKKYEAIGTIEECKSAVERMKPRKTIRKNGYCIAKDTDGNRIYREQNYCPSCGYDITNFQYGFCISCGQAIDME